MDRRALILALPVLTLAPLPVAAEMRRYRLDPGASSVGFTYVLSGAPGKGNMPVNSADVHIDFADLSRSAVTVILDADGAVAASPFVTEALKSADVLWTRAHPQVTFVSRRITGSVRDGARIAGDVTVRGVTRPLTLDAQLYRQRGSASGDLSRITVLLSGAINRSDFGAGGYANLVADRVELRILARLVEAD